MPDLNHQLWEVKKKFNIIGNAKTLNHALHIALQVAKTPMSVLITGENGSGKESFSKILHHYSLYKHGKFIAINCGAIPEGTIDSELFGHEKGSFTGALDNRKGYFEEANKGTVFLDEIGEMPMTTQAKLLRILEYGEYIKIGSSQVRKTDVRVIAATNVDLMVAIQKKKFREDLYYRLNTIPIKVPPLRERGHDIDLLFRKFSLDFADQYNTSPIQLQEEAKKLLLTYHFPGNIRQLKNLVEQISILENQEKNISKTTLLHYLPISSHTLPAIHQKKKTEEQDIFYKIILDMKKEVDEMKKIIFTLIQNQSMQEDTIHTKTTTAYDMHPNQNNGVKMIGENTPEKADKNYEENLSLESIEKQLILKALSKNQQKRKYAAKSLGISERTLYRKLKQYHLEKTI